VQLLAAARHTSWFGWQVHVGSFYPVFSVAFFVALGITLVGTAVIWRIGQKRPPGTPLTWGEAMVGAVFVFGLMLLAYGVVPNEWLKWADNLLLWRSDKILLAISSKGIKTGAGAAHFGGSGRILVSYQSLRDIIVTVIYVMFLGGHIALWSAWQKRGQPKKGADVEPASAYGRPLVRSS
jgi:hypothetical protein